MEANNNNAASAGELDLSFANQGRQTLSFPGYTQTICEGMAITPSGHIMVSATLFKGEESVDPDYGLARLRPDGNIDNEFGQNGYVSGQYTNGTFCRGGPLIIDAKGGMLVSGLNVKAGGGYEQVIVKFNPTGTMNPTFGNNATGYVTVPMRMPRLENSGPGPIGFVRANADPDVKSILFITSKNGIGLIARYHSSGTEDPSFSKDGWLPVEFEGHSISLRNFIERADGKILICGQAGGDGFVRAYDNKGEIDKAFGVDGTLQLKVQHQGKVLGSDVHLLIEQSPHRMLALGVAVDGSGSEMLQHALMIGLTPEGHMDPAFNGGAPVITQANARDLRNWSAGAALNGRAGQRIVTLGQTTEGARRLLTGGFLADGPVDLAFDTEGAASVAFLPVACCLQGSSMLVAGTRDNTTQVIRMFTAAVT